MTHQPAGEADYSDGRLGRLGNIKQVVQQSLVLVVGEQIELVHNEQHRTAAAAIAFLQRIQQESQVLRKTSLKSNRNLVVKQFSCREKVFSAKTSCKVIVTHKHSVTNSVFQLELPCYFFQSYSVVRLQEA